MGYENNHRRRDKRRIAMGRIKNMASLRGAAWTLSNAGAVATRMLAFAPKDALAKLEETERAGATIDFGMYGSSITLRLERAWGINASVIVRLKVAEPETLEDCKVQWFTPYVEVNWSATGRSVATAQAAITAYQEMTNFAALMESALSEKPIYRLVEQAGVAA
jgi:hypothetical protein